MGIVYGIGFTTHSEQQFNMFCFSPSKQTILTKNCFKLSGFLAKHFSKRNLKHFSQHKTLYIHFTLTEDMFRLNTIFNCFHKTVLAPTFCVCVTLTQCATVSYYTLTLATSCTKRLCFAPRAFWCVLQLSSGSELKNYGHPYSQYIPYWMWNQGYTKSFATTQSVIKQETV